MTIILGVFVSSVAFALACGSSTPEPATPEGEAAAEEPAAAAEGAAPETADAGAPKAE
ncbi:MAG: hypothetical protein ABW217_23415 [Polyangiaceae bacterium]